MWSLAVGIMWPDIYEITLQETEVKRMSVIEFIISCLKPVFEWLQALIGEKEETRTEPFNVSEYLRRREKLILELEEEKVSSIRLYSGGD